MILIFYHRRPLYCLIYRIFFTGSNTLLDRKKTSTDHFSDGSVLVSSFISFFPFSYSAIAETNRAVISAGRVIAPPTTSANAPASNAFFACSG